MQVAILLAAFACTALSLEVSKFRTDSDFSIKDNGDGSLTLRSDGMPDHSWEKVNPNEPREQSYNYLIPSNPTFAKTPSCLPMGVIGFTLNGVPIFNPYTAEGQDAGLVERFDSCNGHPTMRGHYHYHIIPKCIYKGGEDELIGVALDGFPIYGPLSSAVPGRKVKSSDLDACHGLCVGGEYRYIVSEDFPYMLGCYKGELLNQRGQRPPGQCSFAISCDAKDSPGSCDSGVKPTASCGNGFGGSGSERTQQPVRDRWSRPTGQPRTLAPSRRPPASHQPPTHPSNRPPPHRLPPHLLPPWMRHGGRPVG